MAKQFMWFLFSFLSMIFCNLLQCNLPLYVTKEDINFKFSKYGWIEEVQIIQKKKSCKLKSFAFVRYRDMNSTYAAVDDPYPPSFYDQPTDKSFVISFSSSFFMFYSFRRIVKVIFAEPKTTLFIMNLPRLLENVTVRKSLEEFTKVCSQSSVLHIKNGFVRYG
jgi:RNA recognition motif-containing protein